MSKKSDLIIYKDDAGRSWHNNKGQLHNENGPAWVETNGAKAWYLNGDLHRTDGPAIEWSDGGKEWHINGKQLTESEFNIRKRGITRVN